MRRSRRDLSLHWFLGVVVAFLIVVPPLVAAGTWTIVANRQQDDAERRLESAMALVRSGASRVDDPAWREQLRNRLDALGVRGVVYEIGSFGKRPISIAEPSAGLRTARLVPLATTDTGVLAAALSPNPPDRAMRLAWALVGGLAILAAELVAALWLVDRWLILPLRRFNDSVDRIAGGESPKPQPRSPLREVGNVSDALVGMSIALQRAAAQDATLERERRFLISAIAHDLRTPLFALRGCIQALRHGFEQRDDYLARAEAKAAQLDRLVNDLFTFARLEYLDERPQAVRLELGELLRQSTATVEQYAAEKHISLSAEGDEIVRVRADRHHLERVISNLLDNALVHTPIGGRISVQWGGDEAVAWFTVADSGSGIPDTALSRVFEPQFRVEGPRTGGTDGAGLGLAIAQRLLNANGGRLTAGNQVGGGALFKATLPAFTQPLFAELPRSRPASDTTTSRR